jgi:hypothetical protein
VEDIKDRALGWFSACAREPFLEGGRVFGAGMSVRMFMETGRAAAAGFPPCEEILLCLTRIESNDDARGL